MCHPYPGPACSEHAFDDYIAAQRQYANCEDPSVSLQLREALLQKQRVYDTTVRGQNALRRSLAELDPTDTGDRFLLEQRQVNGRQLREAQLAAYRLSVAAKRQGLKQEMRDAGVHGRYEYALGFAYAYLAQHYPGWDLEIRDTATIVMTNADSGARRGVFVLPQKYQRPLGEATKNGAVYTFPADPTMEETLNREGRGLGTPSPAGRAALQQHLVSILANGGYDLVAHVNTTGALVELDVTESLFDRIRVGARLQARQSGTSYYTGELHAIERLVRGTAFEHGRVLRLDRPHRVIITGVRPQAKADCYIGDYFMSWRDSTNSYVVKRRGAVVRESLLLKLQRTEPVLQSRTTDAAAALLTA